MPEQLLSSPCGVCIIIIMISRRATSFDGHVTEDSHFMNVLLYLRATWTEKEANIFK